MKCGALNRRELNFHSSTFCIENFPSLLMRTSWTAAFILGFVLSTNAQESGQRIEISEAQASLIQNTFVASPLAAQIDEILVKEGDEIAAGKPMVRLRADVIRTELEAARAAVAAARVAAENDVDARYATRSLEVRERELAMSQDANKNFAGAIPSTEIDKLQLVVDQSRLAIEQAEHDLAIAAATLEEKEAAARLVEARLEQHTIHAPVHGIIVEIEGDAGEWLEAGKPIVRIISTDPIRIECFVDGRKHGKELVGSPVEFRVTGDHPNDEAAKGRVTFVSPELNPVTGQVKLWAEIQNRDQKVRAGMRGSLSIEKPAAK
jgi:multidrug efflux pump subunit AcrA (membrane-fusion protein)